MGGGTALTASHMNAPETSYVKVGAVSNQATA